MDCLYYRGNIDGTYLMNIEWNKCKVEQYLNYMLLIKKPSRNPNDIFKSPKNFYTKETNAQNCNCWTFSKTYYKKKISNKQFHHCEANIYLEKVTKPINSQTNIKSSGNDSLTAKLYKRISNELSPILCLSTISSLIMFTFINPG